MSWTKEPRRDLAGEPELTLKVALRYLGRREYTAKELSQRLAERGAAPEDVAAAVAYAQERGYQDDERAGESHIRQRVNYAPRGRALVRQELWQRGINKELAESLLKKHYPPQLERELLRRVLSKQEQPRAANRQEIQRLWQKTARRLAAKGFNTSLITEELAAWLPEPLEVWD